MMGIEKGTCWDKHWVLYVSEESWESKKKSLPDFFPRDLKFKLVYSSEVFIFFENQYYIYLFKSSIFFPTLQDLFLCI